MKPIDQTNVTPEEIEIGGLQTIDITCEHKKLLVKSYAVIETEWGKRVDFTVCDDWQEMILSSWRIVSKKRYKPVDLIGLSIKLSPIGDDGKKTLLEII